MTDTTSLIHNYRSGERDFIDMRKEDDVAFLRKNFPAMMSQGRSPHMSEGYQFMPSWKIATTLQEKYNMQLVSVAQQRSLKRDPAYQEHTMRFRMPNLPKMVSVGDTVPEIIISNSHNGRSRFKMYAGLFRFVCSNGLVISDFELGGAIFRHFGENNSYDSFREKLGTTARRMQILDERVQRMQEVILRPEDQTALARLMMEARKAPAWMEPHMVLKAHRPEEEMTADGNRNLWTTFNVLQENLANREQEFEIERPDGSGTTTRRLRKIQSAMADVATNEALWQRLEAFIEKRFPTIKGSVTIDHQEAIEATA